MLLPLVKFGRKNDVLMTTLPSEYDSDIGLIALDRLVARYGFFHCPGLCLGYLSATVVPESTLLGCRSDQRQLLRSC